LSEHEDYDSKTKTWFCSKWISNSEWLTIHGYIPKNQSKVEGINSEDYED
jgi:hypothetical protein